MEKMQHENNEAIRNEDANILEIQNLTVYYETEEETVKAVNDISLSLKPRKALGLVGETGAGLRHGDGGAGQHRYLLPGVQKGQQVIVPVGYGDLCSRWEAFSCLLGKAVVTGKKKPLHTVGQQLIAHPG